MAVLISDLVDRMIAARRDRYRHPEPSGKEHRTASLVAGALRAIPAGVDLRGTVGTCTDQDLDVIHRRVSEIAARVASAHGGTAAVGFKDDTCPAGTNDPVIAGLGLVTDAARKIVGEADVSADMVIGGADDMSEILLDVPGYYFFVGGANETRGLTADVHSPDFDFDGAASAGRHDTPLTSAFTILSALDTPDANPNTKEEGQ
ncbi:hypothetical protein ACWD5V_13625 [Streptomyces sp. NPDC002523]